MSKENNQFGVDYAYPGVCSLCHREVAVFEGSYHAGNGVFRPRIVALKPNKREMLIKLDDGSEMRVTICSKCEVEITPEKMADVMESEINGWQVEVDGLLPDWDDEKKKAHMKRYAKRFVVDRIDKPLSKTERLRVKKPDPKKLKIKVRKEKTRGPHK